MNEKKYFDLIYRLWAVMALGAGSKRLLDLTHEYTDPEDLYNALISGTGPAGAVKAAKDIPLDLAEKALEQYISRGIQVISPDDERYPERLKTLYDAPPLLFCVGSTEGMNDRISIAVVGARKASDYSLRVCSGLTSALARSGYDIISGFAEGVDICAHLAAVKNGGHTYAVLGCGVDVLYPRANERYKHLIEENGALISEYLPGAAPHPGNFPNRNRIISALSMGIVVVEAGEHSGSLNSANHGISQGKVIFVVTPGNLFDKRYRGNIELIRNGAVPLMGVKDIYNEYEPERPHTINESVRTADLDETEDPAASEDPIAADENEKTPVPRETKKSRSKGGGKRTAPAGAQTPEPPKKPVIPETTDPVERLIFDALSKNGRIRADDIARTGAAGIDVILEKLMELELENVVREDSGWYILI